MILAATPADPITLYYCKADVKTGLTLRLAQAGRRYKTGGVRIAGADACMAHDNSTGPAKKSGARCVLILTAGAVTGELEVIP